eukprot:CAMPEP_0172310726 /NCGR_PEP_ID=MMETSP1058-20130122/12654_1 /TAXON_ID=83371 /ORGANISM="Detonula confervacea, Strain CCMP 353" /LENGTH=435 /DNA_ID=CAMNT_0013023657 /DNA_START=203 /DNA_END=1510 /DNA_ORIENTATION=-
MRSDKVKFLDEETYELAFEPLPSSTSKAQKATPHRYEIMYGQFLIPYYDRKPRMKMLEIGSGCDDILSASVALWRNLFPQMELWEAGHSSACVERSKERGDLDDDVNILSGDQANNSTLKKWVKDSGGANFDVVIDVGGHVQCQSMSSFETLWRKLLPGGLYFFENMNVSSSHVCDNNTQNVLDMLKQKLDITVHAVQDDAKFFFCQQDACVIGKNGPTLTNYGESIFFSAAKSLTPTTDKVTSHRYQIMYGQFLIPYYERKPHMKMLEIGLGCDMNYGPGASVALWRKLFPQTAKWEAEYGANCVEKSKERGDLDGLSVLVGDQGDIPTLDNWVHDSGGANFDVVIDDGGHQQCQIWTTFLKLWPPLLPGGLYFIEDLQVSRHRKYQGHGNSLCKQGTNVVEMMKEMIDDLVHQRQTDVQFIFCQRDACMLRKK